MSKDPKRNLTWQNHVDIVENIRKDDKWIRQLENDRKKLTKQLTEIEINLAFAKLWFAKHCLATKNREAGRRHIVEATKLASRHLSLWQSLDFLYEMIEHEFHDDIVDAIAERKAEFEDLTDLDAIRELSWILVEAMWKTHRFEAYELFKLLPPSGASNATKCDDSGSWHPPAA